jgi:hypothetical protein
MRSHIAALCVLALTQGCGSSGGGGEGDASVADASLDSAVDAWLTPPFRNPVSLDDSALATRALQLLGANVAGADQRCNGCHSLTRQQLRYWRALGDTSMTECLTDLPISNPESAAAMIDCLRFTPGDSTTPFLTRKLGIWASAGALPWFEALFARGGLAADYGYFRDIAAMPPAGTTALTQDQFDIVAEWFVRGLPLLEKNLPEDPAPAVCTSGVSADVAAHVAELAVSGWRQVNQDSGMLMYGCAGAPSTRACMADKPQASATLFGATWELPGSVLRVLKELDYASSYWTRSSPDGRHVGHGTLARSSAIVDLAEDRIIPVDALYDPGFFPDNSGFIFQGSSRNVCPMSVLANSPASISMNEPGCNRLDQVGLYQHVAAALGGDYFTVDGNFVSDDGGHFITLGNPEAYFGQADIMSFTPLIFDGSEYQAKPSVPVPSPYEGDAVISPSARLIVTRVAGPGDRQLGYVLRKLIATPTSDSYQIETPEIARYCATGGKPGFSYDERWMVFHHYVTDADAVDLGFTGRSDPGFQGYRAFGAANVYLADLASGAITRITHMKPGQYALYPHFRSDGWIYIQVREPGAGKEYIVASDAALALEPS